MKRTGHITSEIQSLVYVYLPYLDYEEAVMHVLMTLLLLSPLSICMLVLPLSSLLPANQQVGDLVANLWPSYLNFAGESQCQRCCRQDVSLTFGMR